MTTNHIDQLKEWYAQAESGPVNVGDTVIYRHAGQWIVDVSTVPYDNPDNRDIRILARASKPKPAWHGAVAVMARCSNAPEDHREPFIRSEATHDVWAGEAGHARTGDLRDVTPLIEQKVTDEMVLAALNASTGLDLPHLTSFKRDEIEDMRCALTAALGLEAA